MNIDCANCVSSVCETGHVEAVPERCPMRGDFPDFQTLYAGGEARQLVYQATLIEAEGYGRWTRMEETAELARRMGYRRPDRCLHRRPACRTRRRDRLTASPRDPT